MLKEDEIHRRIWFLEDKVHYLAERVPEAFIAGWAAAKNFTPEEIEGAYQTWKEK